MFLALREFRHSRLRYCLIAAVIAMVASLVFILSGLANGLAAGNSQAITAFDADGFAVASGSEFSLDRSRLSPETVQAIAQAEGIEEAQPFSTVVGNVRVAESEDLLSVSVIAVPIDTFLEPTVADGQQLGDQPDGVVIDQSLATEGVNIGDTLVFEPGRAELRVVGITEGRQYRLAPTLYINLDLVTDIQPDIGNAVSGVAMRGSEEAIGAVPDSIEGIETGSTSTIVQNLPGYTEQRATLLLIQIFLVVIAAGIIAAFFFILTIQKMPELGVMKALGATTGVLARALIAQAAILAAIGIVIGIVAGDLVSLAAAGAVPYQVRWQQMALYGALLLIVAIAGTLLSLVRIVRVDPLDAINRVN